MTDFQLVDVLNDARNCELCARHLPHSPRPVVRAAEGARLLIIGQAPGARVHASGIPWDDPSGERLRDWLGVSQEIFYDESQVAIVPMGFCYPGKGRSGDLPPRPECAPRWHAELLACLPEIQLTLLIGQYAQQYYLASRSRTLTDTVKNWRKHLPEYFALPHPSPRNYTWLARNLWFARDVLPELKRLTKKCLNQ
ncbi:MAG: uracil-DNA glycosylase family protein [Zhongshania sp.]|uniref:uracil-DNA glycosylase family protein n=1 Tax=Zhongshania sp. TaxID=1971902 RepID=UPI00261BA69E|nr:uracil-DNA glycosylase family protein [Zhongshania sp.]MDF1693332.1 uracil-DNA glycosylase family protein [Zhongshania sp.]